MQVSKWIILQSYILTLYINATIRKSINQLLDTLQFQGVHLHIKARGIHLPRLHPYRINLLTNLHLKTGQHALLFMPLGVFDEEARSTNHLIHYLPPNHLHFLYSKFHLIRALILQKLNYFVSVKNSLIISRI